jgi:polar amino acid transport system permease protein
MNWLESIRQNFIDLHAMRQVLPDLLLTGLRNTLMLSLAATALGLIIGIVLAVMGISRSGWLRRPARVYTDIFRGLPAILTILLVGQGLGQVGLTLFGTSPYPLAILALGLIAGAYLGEIFRAGIQSVEKGQLEACRALGMSYVKAMRLVIVPQGVRRVLPALVNQFIAIVKDSSLVYFLGLLTSQRELFRIGQDAAVNTGNLSPLVAAGLCYCVITIPLTHLVNYFDQRLRAGRRITHVASGLDELDELEGAVSARGEQPIAPVRTPILPGSPS